MMHDVAVSAHLTGTDISHTFFFLLGCKSHFLRVIKNVCSCDVRARSQLIYIKAANTTPQLLEQLLVVTGLPGECRGYFSLLHCPSFTDRTVVELLI